MAMTIKRIRIERVVLRGPMSQRDEAWAFLDEGGYRCVMSGPRRLSAMRADVSRYHIIAEREARDGTLPNM